MDTQTAINILNSRAENVVTKPGKYRTKVGSINLYDGKWLVNTNLITTYHVKEIERLVSEDNIEAALNQKMVATIFSNDNGEFGYVPSKGEFINVLVDFVDTKEGKGLFITSIAAIQVEETSKITFNFQKQVKDEPFTTNEEILTQETA